jgi:hypothetical protein
VDDLEEIIKEENVGIDQDKHLSSDARLVGLF